MPALHQTEPARLTAFVTALIGVATAFSLWRPAQAQVGALMALVAVLGGEYVRQAVTPNAKLPGAGS